MRAWQYPAPGHLDTTLSLVSNARKPEPQEVGNAQVLVQVISCGLNPADYKVQELGIIARAIVGFPKTVGMDLCGKVISTGNAVTDVQVGGHVLGRVNPQGKPGALCDYVVVDRAHVAVLAPSEDPDRAAALPTAALTAYQSIAPHVQEGRGDRIFINGGSGGVGTLGIQVAKLLGCHVSVSCSTAKVELCRDLGADEIIDYKTTNVTEKLKKDGHGFQLIVDNVGNSPADLFSAGNSYLREGCPYVFVGGKMSFTSVKNLILARLLPGSLGGAKGKLVIYITKTTQHDIELVSRWAAEGKLRVIVDKVFEFEEAKTAMQYVKKGSSSGKTVVRVQGQ